MAAKKTPTPETGTPETDTPAPDKDAYYAALLAEKVAAGLSKEDAETVVKWQREEDGNSAMLSEKEPG